MGETRSSDAPWLARQMSRVKSHPLVTTLVVGVSLLAGLLALPSQVDQAWDGLTQIGPVKKFVAQRREASLKRERERLLCPALAKIERAPKCPVDSEWISLGEAGEAAVVRDGRDRFNPRVYLFGFREGQQLYGTDLGFQTPSSQVWSKSIAGTPWFIVHNVEGSCGFLGFDIFTISKIGTLKKPKVIDPVYGPLPADLGLLDYRGTEPVLVGCSRQLRDINGEWIVFAPDKMYRLRLDEGAVRAEVLDPTEEIYAGSDTGVFVINERGRVTLDGVEQVEIVRVNDVPHTLVRSAKLKFVISQPDGRMLISPADTNSSKDYSEEGSVIRFQPGGWFLSFDMPNGRTRRVLLQIEPEAGG